MNTRLERTLHHRRIILLGSAVRLSHPASLSPTPSKGAYFNGCWTNCKSFVTFLGGDIHVQHGRRGLTHRRWTPACSPRPRQGAGYSSPPASLPGSLRKTSPMCPISSADSMQFLLPGGWIPVWRRCVVHLVPALVVAQHPDVRWRC